MISRFYTPDHIIRRATSTENDYGEPVLQWADHLTVEGKLWPLSGDERLSADKETYFSTHKFATAIADILETDRYQDPDGNEYYIKAILSRTRPDGSGHYELSLERIQ